MTLSNFAAYMAQIAIVVIACAGSPRALGLRAPGVQYVFWRVVLLLCLALPFIQPFRALESMATTLAIASVTPSAVPFVDKVSTGVPGESFYSLRFDPVFAGAVAPLIGGIRTRYRPGLLIPPTPSVSPKRSLLNQKRLYAM